MGNPRVHYTYFDFHHECKGLRFDRVSVLIDSLDEELHQQGFVGRSSSLVACSHSPVDTFTRILRLRDRLKIRLPLCDQTAWIGAYSRFAVSPIADHRHAVSTERTSCSLRSESGSSTINCDNSEFLAIRNPSTSTRSSCISSEIVSPSSRMTGQR